MLLNKTQVRRTKRQIEGTATGSKIRGAPEPVRDMFITRLTHDTTNEDLHAYISKNKINIIGLEQDSRFKIFPS